MGKTRGESLMSQRWILAYLFSAGFFFLYSLRVNISVAIVCMVKTPQVNISLEETVMLNSTDQGDYSCGELVQSDMNNNQNAELEWDKNTKSLILSAYYYGYIITQVPGGWLADRFGGRLVFGAAMAIAGLSTVLTPVCARTSPTLVFILRFIIGFASGVGYPACHSMWGRWAPVLERSKLVAVSHAGAWVGLIATFSSSGALCEYGFDNGWGSIFYITGGLCCLWVIIWFLQVRDSPDDHHKISGAEKEYIIKNTEFDTRRKTQTIPWKEMAMSVPLWAIVIAHVCTNWTEYTLTTSLPEFLKNVLKFDIKSNGLLSAAPYICIAIMTLLVGNLADYIRSRHILTTTQTRKVFQSIAFIGAAIFLVATGFVPCTKRDLAIVFLCIAVSSTGFMQGGFMVNHIDIAPRYGGILVGITNTVASIPGMISPIVAGMLTPNDTPYEWRNVFYIGAAFYVFGSILYGLFASGKVQPWAIDKEKDPDITIEVQPLSSDHIHKIADS